MLAHQGIERTWPGIYHAMKRLGNNNSGSLASFKEHGSRIATLSNEERARVSELLPRAAESAAVLDQNAESSSSPMVIDSDSEYGASEAPVADTRSEKAILPRASKRRAGKQIIDQDVPHKRQKSDVPAKPLEGSRKAARKEIVKRTKKRKPGSSHMRNLEQSPMEETDQHEHDEEMVEEERPNDTGQAAISNPDDSSCAVEKTMSSDQPALPATINDDAASKLSELYGQIRDVVANLRTQANGEVHPASLEGEHSITALVKLVAECKEQELSERAEARCKELEEQRDKALAQVKFRERNKDIQDKIGDLDVPNQVALRKYITDVELERERLQAQGLQNEFETRWMVKLEKDKTMKIREELEQKVNHVEELADYKEAESQRTIERLKKQAKQAEAEFKRTIERLEEQATQAEAEAQRRIKHLEEQANEADVESQRTIERVEAQAKEAEAESQRKIKHLQSQFKYLEDDHQKTVKRLEEEAAQKETHYEEQLERYLDINARLYRDLDYIRSGKTIFQAFDGGFPVKYDPIDLHAQWKNALVKGLDHMTLAHANNQRANVDVETTVREDPSFPGLAASLQMVTGVPTLPAGDLNIDSVFERCITPPSDFNVALACFMAYALRWCFDTNFHIDDDQECKKLQEVWDTVARDTGLKGVRRMDMLATMRKVRNDFFRLVEIPQMAREKMAILKEEFKRWLPVSDEAQKIHWEGWLERLMIVKLELLTSDCLYKIAFVSPGTPFDNRWMYPVTEVTGGFRPKEGVNYQVRICLSPALISNITEPDWPDANSADLDPDKYRDALLQNRDFFSKEPGPWNNWPDCRCSSPAWVVLDPIPDDIVPVE